jgi:flagellar protein FliO/FliZ
LTVRGEDAEISAPQAAAGVPEMPGAEYLVQLILSLLIVVITIVVVAWILRRVMRMQSSAGGNMRILAGLSLGSRERIVVVEAGDTQLLLGVAPGRVVALHVFGKPVFTQTTQPTGRFAKHLQSKIEGSNSA